MSSGVRDGHQTRGIYKLMSVDDIHQQLVWVTPSDIYMIRLKIFDLLRCCGVDTKDLMVKYHQNKTVVDDICKNKAGQGIDVPAL